MKGRGDEWGSESGEREEQEPGGTEKSGNGVRGVR